MRKKFCSSSWSEVSPEILVVQAKIDRSRNDFQELFFGAFIISGDILCLERRVIIIFLPLQKLFLVNLLNTYNMTIRQCFFFQRGIDGEKIFPVDPLKKKKHW